VRHAAQVVPRSNGDHGWFFDGGCQGGGIGVSPCCMTARALFHVTLGGYTPISRSWMHDRCSQSHPRFRHVRATSSCVASVISCLHGGLPSGAHSASESSKRPVSTSPPRRGAATGGERHAIHRRVQRLLSVSR